MFPTGLDKVKATASLLRSKTLMHGFDIGNSDGGIALAHEATPFRSKSSTLP
jgi:hypothetical protein